MRCNALPCLMFHFSVSLICCCFCLSRGYDLITPLWFDLCALCMYANTNLSRRQTITCFNISNVIWRSNMFFNLIYYRWCDCAQSSDMHKAKPRQAKPKHILFRFCFLNFDNELWYTYCTNNNATPKSECFRDKETTRKINNWIKQKGNNLKPRREVNAHVHATFCNKIGLQSMHCRCFEKKKTRFNLSLWTCVRLCVSSGRFITILGIDISFNDQQHQITKI